MQKFFKDYSTVPYIKNLKVEKYDPNTNVFSYPPDKNDRFRTGKTYGTCDPELDAIELPL